MSDTERLEQCKIFMYEMINLIKRVVPLKKENQVLIVLQLDSIEKIQKWLDWLRPKWKGDDELMATEAEIVRAAVQIGKELM